MGDVVRAFIAGMQAAEAGRTDVYNICTGRATTSRALAETVAALGPSAPCLRHAEARAGDIRVSLGDPGKSAADLGLAAPTPLDLGLARTLEWRATAG